MLVCFFIMTFIIQGLRAQSIFKTWYCESANVCMILKKNGWTSSLNEITDRLKVKLKKQRLLIKFTPDFTAVYKIEKLTSDTLILSQDMKRRERFEHISDSIITLIAVDSCYHRLNFFPPVYK